MATLKPQSNGPLYSNTVIGTLAVDGWAVTVGTVHERAVPTPSPLLTVPNVTPTHQLHIVPRGTVTTFALSYTSVAQHIKLASCNTCFIFSDRETDGQTDIFPRHSSRYAYASRGKNCVYVFKYD